MSRNIRTWFAEANAADCVDRDSTLAKNHVTRSVNLVRKRWKRQFLAVVIHRWFLVAWILNNLFAKKTVTKLGNVDTNVKCKFKLKWKYSNLFNTLKVLWYWLLRQQRHQNKMLYTSRVQTSLWTLSQGFLSRNRLDHETRVSGPVWDGAGLWSPVTWSLPQVWGQWRAQRLWPRLWSNSGVWTPVSGEVWSSLLLFVLYLLNYDSDVLYTYHTYVMMKCDNNLYLYLFIFYFVTELLNNHVLLLHSIIKLRMGDIQTSANQLNRCSSWPAVVVVQLVCSGLYIIWVQCFLILAELLQ